MQKSDNNSSVVSKVGEGPLRASSLPLVHTLHVNSSVAEYLRQTLEDHCYSVMSHSTFNAFIQAYVPDYASCLLAAPCSQNNDGFKILRSLRVAEISVPVIFLIDRPPVSLVRSVLREGCGDFLPSVPQTDELIEAIKEASSRFGNSTDVLDMRADALKKLASLSPRQRRIMEMVISGHTNKVMAFKLGISQRTVETHRAAIMKKLGVKKHSVMVRLGVLAGWDDSAEE